VNGRSTVAHRQLQNPVAPQPAAFGLFLGPGFSYFVGVPSEFDSIFARLRSILQKHAGTLSVNEDTSTSYSLAAKTGPATLKAWDGKMKRPTIPVVWVHMGKAYVSYHLMGVGGNSKLADAMSAKLKARMQGGTCFNFVVADDELFAELDRLTAASIAAFRNAGFIIG
jgi:hypothetical protein